MNIEKIKEIGVIKSVSAQFSKVPPASVIKGIGDDCAIIRKNENEAFLITTDMLVENTHFLRNKISAYQLGYKSLAVNLNDIASMGGTPYYATLSLGLPKDISTQWLNDFLQGIKFLAGNYNVSLIGGDTTYSENIVISITLSGDAKTKDIKLRSEAQTNDIVCVNGFLGDSGGGLKFILDDHHIVHNDTTNYLMNAHYRPNVYIEEGAWLSLQTGVNAMTDVSDGIGMDLKFLADASKKGFEIETSNLPISPQLSKACRQLGWNPIDIAINAGEDYCLLTTINETDFADVQRRYQKKFNKPLYPIGRVTSENNVITYLKDGSKINFATQGYEHF